MASSPSDGPEVPLWTPSPWHTVARRVARLCRLPFDLLFLTWDYLRFTLWALMHLRAPLLAARLTHFGPQAASDAIEVSGRRVRRCTLARKYGNPALLRLLLPGIFPGRVRHGKVVWAWEQGSIQRPTTATRYISLGLGLLLLWGSPTLLLVLPASRNAIRQCLLGLRPPSAQSPSAEAERLMADGDLDGACMSARTLLHDEPGNAVAHLQLASIYLQKELPSLAIEHCQAAVAAERSSQKAHRLLAEAYIMRGELTPALLALEAILRDSPDDLESLVRRAACQARTGTPTEAIDTLGWAALRHPASAIPLTELGRQYYAMDQPAEALAAFRKAYDLAPDEWSTQNNLAQVLAAQGEDLDQALELSLKALSLAPTSPVVVDTLGWIYVLRREYDKAAPLLTFAAVAMGNSPQVLYHAAELRARTGDQEAALRFARRAAELGGDDPDAVRAKQLVEGLTAGKKP